MVISNFCSLPGSITPCTPDIMLTRAAHIGIICHTLQFLLSNRGYYARQTLSHPAEHSIAPCTPIPACSQGQLIR